MSVWLKWCKFQRMSVSLHIVLCLCREIKDLGKRFDQAVRKYRLTKELHEKLVEQGQITEELIGEMEQENHSLVNRIEE